MNSPTKIQPPIPRAPIERLTKPIERYLQIEASSGILLLIAAIVALVAANSPWSHSWHALWQTKCAISVGAWTINLTLEHWINDGLMVLFFFTIGMEVKYELVLGELRKLKHAILPLAAAIGGMVVPAAIYLAMLWGHPAQRGWGIPMATDIAFVVGCLAIIGRRVPHTLRVMLLTLAIADDIGAILVIAVGYSSSLNLTALGAAAGGLGLVWLCALVGIRSFLPYIILGVGIWLGVLISGLHATLAGVILGLMTPARSVVGPAALRGFLNEAAEYLRGQDDEAEPSVGKTRVLSDVARQSVSPLSYLQSVLHPWVSFVIMPVFALANAGVEIDPAELGKLVTVGTALGLAIGKPVGILLACCLLALIGLGGLPERATWRGMIGGACLCGIGFTMSLFITSLALKSPELEDAKLGVLVGSALSAIVGMGILWTLPKPADETPGAK